jgi:hypothetical protein
MTILAVNIEESNEKHDISLFMSVMHIRKLCLSLKGPKMKMKKEKQKEDDDET